jgi:hypothetical protein
MIKTTQEILPGFLADMYQKMDQPNRERMLKLVEDLKDAEIKAAFQAQLDRLTN